MEFERKDSVAASVNGSNAASVPPRRSLDSRDILAGSREVMIRHGDSTYRLRSTNKGKLILTK